MASSARSSRTTADSFPVTSKWREREIISPERTKVWTEQKTKSAGEKRVPVVYYLCRNGQLDHPHFIEVPLSSNDGLYLRDVINRLNDLRGKGMASMYSWSSKRSYKNGFVWQDLSANDFIYPAQGQEYVLKGSEILDHCLIQNPRSLLETASFRAPRSQESLTGESSDSQVISRRRNQSWSSIDLGEYKVFKPTESSADSSSRLAADASTQTDDRRRRRKPHKNIETEESSEGKSSEIYENGSTELSREEISPPPSDSSPETLESLMKADGRLTLFGNEENHNDRSIQAARSEIGVSSGRIKASAVLMQLISCGTMSFRDSCATALAGDGKAGVLRIAGKEAGAQLEYAERTGVKLEDKEYFSGSFVDTQKAAPPSLKRSSSYEEERNSGMEGGKNEMDDEALSGKCIPRKPKPIGSKPGEPETTSMY